MFLRILASLLFTGCSFATFGQLSWREIPANSNAVTANAYDIAVADNGYYYMAYTLVNGSTGNYDVYFDVYTVDEGWVNLLVHPTTNDSNIDIRMLRNHTHTHAIVNTSNSNELTLFQLNGASAYVIDTENFPAFSNNSTRNLFPGSSVYDLYFMYSGSGYNRLYAYDYNSSTWSSAGNPFINSGVTPSTFEVYANQDSVYVAGRYNYSPEDKIKLVGAQKGIWSWGNHTPANTSVYAMNSTVADSITTLSSYYLYGDHLNSKSFIVKDGTAPKYFPITNTYGQQAVFPLNYDNDAKVTTDGTNVFMTAIAANLANTNVVYQKPIAGGSWSAVAGSFEVNSITPASKRIATRPSGGRIMIGYKDGTDHILKITNNPPTLFDPGTIIVNLCANSPNEVLSGLRIEDLDDDAISLLNVVSSNPTLIDPANVMYSYSEPDLNYFDFYVSAEVGNAATQQAVTLTFNFTDGFDIYQVVRTYQVLPNEPVTFVSDPLIFCSNGDPVDLYNYTNIPGGDFGIVESDYDGHYLDPADYSSEDNFQLFYYVTDGTCGSSTEVTILFNDAPAGTINTTPTTDCTADNGTALLTITNGAAPVEFVWNNGNFGDLELFNLAAGAVHADLIDANGCYGVADGIVENTTVSITATVTDVSCNGAGDGAIDVTIAGLATPYTYFLWSNGSAAEDVSDLQPGTHTLWITDANGCTASAAFEVDEPDPLYIYLQYNNTTCGASEGNAYINNLEGGTLPYTYAWNNGGTTDIIENIASGIYSVTVTDANGCTISSTVGVSDFDAPYEVLTSQTGANCNASDGSISVDTFAIGTNVQLDWSNGEHTPTISGLAPGIYTMHLYNSEGCSRYSAYEVLPIAPAQQQICVVTVDSTTSTNLVVWTKNDVPSISHFNIYRESMTAGQFQLIDTVQNSNLSIFNDVVASPVDRSWKYRISAVDECGIASVQSGSHKTIHLTTIDEGNGDFKAVWNHYQGTNYTTYNIYRFTNTSGWQFVANVPASLTYYLDSPLETDGLDYMVDFELGSMCTADFTRAQDFNSSRSNKDKGQFSAGEGTGDSNNGLVELAFGGGTVTLYPNPVSGETVWVALDGLPKASYSIVSVTGQHIADGTLNSGTNALQLHQLEAGVYILQLFNNNEATTLRFIVN